MPSLRNFCLVFMSLWFGACGTKASVGPDAEKKANILKDVQSLCETVPKSYVYFQSRAAHWSQACQEAENAIASTTSSAQRLAVIEGLIDALYDNHLSLRTNSGESPRLVPSGSDYWISDGVVTAVRPNSAAAKAGLNVGDKVVKINGVSVEAALQSRLRPKGVVPSEKQAAWALNAAAAGYRHVPRSVTVARNDGLMDLSLEGFKLESVSEPVSYKMLGDSVGYIRINNRLGDSATVPAFNAALDNLADAESWILDLRDTPGGGGTDVAEPIMGRFIDKPMAYQKILPMDEAVWEKRVGSAGPDTKTGSLAILVGRWTGSMGEGIAIGFDGMGRGHVIGSDMARLNGGIDDFTLPATGIGYGLPTYDLAHLDGTPRHEWSPEHYVVADNGQGSDLALLAAIEWIKLENP